VAASFMLGLGAQSLKICTDTLVQAHIDDTYKGRVFIIYDMVFNAALATAAAIAALVLPPDGVSVPSSSASRWPAVDRGRLRRDPPHRSASSIEEPSRRRAARDRVRPL
jgi:hypothetical protein